MAEAKPSIEDYANWLDENQEHPYFEKVQGAYSKLVEEDSAEEDSAEEEVAVENSAVKNLVGGSGVVVREEGALEELMAEAYAQRPTPPENKPGDFMRGLSSGKDYGDLLIGSALEGSGNLTGIQSLVDYGQGSIASNQAELDKLSGDMIQFDDFKILEDPGKFLDWSQQTIGAAIPITGTSIAAGVAGGAAIAYGGASAFVIGAGSAAISTASMLPFMFGGNREEQKQAIEEGFREEIDEWTAAAAALPQAAFEILAQKIQLRGLGELVNRYIISEGGFLTKIVKDFLQKFFKLLLKVYKRVVLTTPLVPTK